MRILLLMLVLCYFSISKTRTERTGIFIRALTSPGQVIFIRGGISAHVRPGCTGSGDADSDPCSIPITHLVQPADPGSSYGQWSQEDHYLDWYGAEDDQPAYNGTRRALGTPMMWTTDQYSEGGPTIEQDGYGYTPLNRFGEHYWFVDLEMDCQSTEDGWFEFKVFTLLGGWESNVEQYVLCAGQPDRSKPHQSVNHLGLCGKLNVFFEAEGECSIYEMPENPEQPPSDSCGNQKMFDDGNPNPPFAKFKKYQTDKQTKHTKRTFNQPPVINPKVIDASNRQHFKISLLPDIDNEKRDDPGKYIVNGLASSIGRWPWQGVLQFGDIIGGCAAVLIDAKWALAASHCVFNSFPSTLKVRIGEQNLAVTQGHEQVLQVSKIHIHECYQSDDCGDIPYNDYDLAILELAQSADLTQYVANTACLPYGYGLDSFVGDYCVATGFGDTKGTGDSYRMYEIDVPVYTHEDCVTVWGGDRITERQLCMGTEDKSACGGDSGGPLVCWKDDKWQVVGVTSWGTSECSGMPSVYSRVTSFLDWIQEITGLN